MADLRKLLAEATPGPWKWRLEDGPEWFLSPGILKVEGGMTDGTPMGDAIDRANARLIAMAPDLAAEVIALREQKARLLAAMQNIADWMDDPEGPHIGGVRGAKTISRAAIAEIEKEAGE